MLSCEFSKISNNTFFTEHLQKTASVFSFSEQPPEVFYKNGCSRKLPKIHRKTPLVCEIFKNTFFTEHLRTTASAYSFSKAATGVILWQKVFLKISENLQENTFGLRNFQKQLFYRTPLDVCFWLFRATLLKWGTRHCLENFRWIFII